MKNNMMKSYKKLKKSFIREIIEWIFTMGITIIVTLFIVANIFSITQVKGKSMEPTFLDGERVINYKLGYNFTDPKRSEIIIVNTFESKNGIISNVINEAKDIMDNISYKFTKKSEVKYIIKRIIAIPGDTIDIRDGSVYLNDNKLEESYIKGQTFENSDFSYPLDIPVNKVFVLGDNREHSLDSRGLGLIDYEQIKGKVSFRLWPLKRFGTISKY